MNKAVEDYIKKYTNQFSNEDGFDYIPWLTPDHARRVAQIAMEETIKQVCEWLYNHNDYICGSTNGIARYDMDKLIKDLKKHLEE